MTREEKKEAIEIARFVDGMSLSKEVRWEVYNNRKGHYWVYLIGSKELNWYKIGIAKYPERRLLEFNLPFEVVLLEAVPVAKDKNLSGARHIERLVHNFYKDKNVRGEWFTSIDVVEFLEVVKQKLNENKKH